MTAFDELERRVLANRDWPITKDGLTLLAQVYANRNQDPKEWIKCETLLRQYKHYTPAMPFVRDWARRPEMVGAWQDPHTQHKPAETEELPLHMRLVDLATRERHRFWGDFAEYIDHEPKTGWWGRWEHDGDTVDWYPEAMKTVLANWGMKPRASMGSLNRAGLLATRHQGRYGHQVRLANGEAVTFYRVRLRPAKC